MAEIVLDGITKRYPDGTEAVRRLDLHVRDGEFMILVGPSGCGKSTALRMVAGLEDISDGELRIGDRVANELDPKDRDIAMVFQSYALYPHMTVRENMGFALKLAKVPSAQIAERVDEAARVLGLSEYLDRKPARLSGGQRQRVAMGRAIVRQPAAFLMDEPLSNLDAKLRVQTRTELARIQARLGTTTIYVTHDQTEAMTLGDRVAVMRAGELQQVAAPMDLYEAPRNLFVAGFIGSPAMNFLPGRALDDGRLQLPMAVVPAPAAIAAELAVGTEYVVGIRPEHFEDARLVSGEERGRGVTFRADVDLVEAMGAEQFAYLSLDPAAMATAADADGRMGGSAELEAMAADAGLEDLPDGGISGERLVARLHPEAKVQRRTSLEVWLDVPRIHVFDAATGLRLGATGSTDAETPPT